MIGINIIDLITQIEHEVQYFVEPLLVEYELDDLKWHELPVLVNLMKKKSMDKHTLISSINSSQDFVDRVLVRLIDIGYVASDETESGMMFSVTEKFNSIREKVSNISDSIHSNAFEGFSKDEKAILVALLTRTKENLEKNS